MTSKKAGTAVAVAGLAAILAACQPQAQQPAETAAVDTAAVRASIDSLRESFEADFAAADFAAMADYYAADALYSHPGLPTARGRDSIQAVMERTHPPEGTIEITPMDLRVLGSDWAYEYGVGTVTFTPEGAEEPVEASSTYLVVLHRTADGWKLHRESLSANGPMPGNGH